MDLVGGMGERNGNGHKYTKNVCMTGHNIKYHQYRMLNFLSISLAYCFWGYRNVKA